MTKKPAKGNPFPWWVWLFIILFPIPFGVHWWVTLIFLAIFAVLLGTITRDYRS